MLLVFYKFSYLSYLVSMDDDNKFELDDRVKFSCHTPTEAMSLVQTLCSC